MQLPLLAIVLSLLVGCGSSKKATKSVADAVERDRSGPHESRTADNKGDMTVSTDTGGDLSWLQPVYFALDSSDLQPGPRETLARLHDWLAAHRDVKVLTIEGHCDEQGTEEYNIGLGQRRSQAIVDYLTRLGTDPRRLRAVSYGALRPAMDGHDEVAWAKNRRGEFRVEP